ncbi:MAG: hypothetical protein ACHQK9_03710, partial [Reyranellales bacterium]
IGREIYGRGWGGSWRLGLGRLRGPGAAANIAAMPLFDPPVSPRLLWPVDAPWPKRRARALLKRFQGCFPELVYDMDLTIGIANAQATLDGNRLLVRLYGGLVRHRNLTSAGLAVVLAHETGHHLGGPPRHHVFRWLSSEERATEWAMTEGLQSVFGERHAETIGKRGTKNLQLIRSS